METESGTTPQTVDVALNPPYRVTIGAGVLERALEYSPIVSRSALLADERVAGLYAARLGPLAGAPRLEIPGGESAKRFGPLERVLDFLAAADLDRESLLVTLGGGSIGDLGGLAASLFKRGIAVMHLPTTLLAQVDAAVGGKTAINLDAGKNLVGTFHQPCAVLADTSTLASLDDREWRSGLGEVVKTALVAGEAELTRLEQLAPQLAERGAGAGAAIAEVVGMCVRTKAGVVARDPAEHGVRRSLNLGHTFAHGIEHGAHYGEIPHGIAVAVGLRLAVRASEALGILADRGLETRLTRLLTELGLPTRLVELEGLAAGGPSPAEVVLAGMAQDKKGAVGVPELVLPVRAGKLELAVRADPARLRSILESA